MLEKEYIVKSVCGFSESRYEELMNEMFSKGYELVETKSLLYSLAYDGRSILIFRRTKGE